MRKNLAKIIALCSVLLLLLSCGIPTTLPTAPSNLDPTLQAAAFNMLVQTRIAETLSADPANIVKTLIAASQIAVPPVVLPTQVPQILPPTETQNILQPPTSTPTPEKVYLTVSQNTYCRTGPLAVFPRVTTILTTDRVEVIARNPDNDTYYVRVPNVQNTFCWVWGQYAILTGNPGGLLVYTPQPTPLPTFTSTPAANFSVGYSRTTDCTVPVFHFQVVNTGNITWQSIYITLTDRDTGITAGGASNTFDDEICPDVFSQNDLTAGESGPVSLTRFDFEYDVTGHRFIATFTLCAQDGMIGPCMTKTTEFVSG